MEEEAPKLFISYSWTAPENEEWVYSLATDLEEIWGVDVMLDKWGLKEGHDANAFMEKMVTDPEINKVAIICDRHYAAKANGRSGGVGVETQIITPEIYAKQDQTKFVAILPERDSEGNPFLPAYYKSRIYIDLSNPDLYAKNFEQLLRWIYDKPLYVKPKRGKPPAFLVEDSTLSLRTTAPFNRALKAVRENKPYCSGALREYFETFAKNLEQFRIKKDDTEEFDEKVIRNIEEFLPYRNEAIELFLALARYRPTQESWETLHRFIEGIFPYIDKPEEVTRYQEWDFDNFKFIVHELFLYAIASLLRFECFAGVAFLVGQHYYVDQYARDGGDAMLPFTEIRGSLETLNYRDKRLKLGRISLHADILAERAKSSGLPFRQLMQADLVLFVRDCLDVLRTERLQRWWPVTLVYASRQHGPFEIFARSQSARYFENVRQVFDISGKEDLMPLVAAFKEQRLSVPAWDFRSANIFNLMGFDKIASLS